jgi:hypothetical protein
LQECFGGGDSTRAFDFELEVGHGGGGGEGGCFQDRGNWGGGSRAKRSSGRSRSWVNGRRCWRNAGDCR